MIRGCMEILLLRIEKNEKEVLKSEAKKLGLTLTAYCRMLLIQAIQLKK